MAVNKVNAMKLLEVVKACRGGAFRMGVWDCGTAACLGGKAERIMLSEGVSKWRVGYSSAEVGEWLGLDWKRTEALFNMMDSGWGTYTFDQLPARVRKTAGVKVVDLLMKGQGVRWAQAIRYALKVHGVEVEPKGPV